MGKNKDKEKCKEQRMIVYVVKLFDSYTFDRNIVWNTDGAIVGIFDSEDKAKDAIERLAQNAVEERMYDTYTYEPIQLNKNLLRGDVTITCLTHYQNPRV